MGQCTKKCAERIAKECSDILNNFCESKEIIVNQQSDKPEYFSIQNGTILSYGISENRKYAVVKFKQNIWLNLTIKFNIETISAKQFDYSLERIYLKFFSGSHYDEEKDLLFRLEWENSNNDSYKHAQPHWHIYPQKVFSNICMDNSNFKTIQELLNDPENSFDNYLEDRENEVIQSKKLSLSDFHFSVKSDWNTAQNPKQIHTLDGTDCKNWLRNALGYISLQFEYLLNSQ